MSKLDATEQEKQEILDEVLGRQEGDDGSRKEVSLSEKDQEEHSVEEDDLDDAVEDDDREVSEEVEDEEEPVLDQEVVDRAIQQYGYTPDRLGVFENTEQLERALAEQDRLILQWQQYQQQAMQQQQQRPQQQPGQQQASPQAEDELSKVLEDMDEDDPVRKAVEGLLQKQGQTTQYMQQMAAYIQHQQQAEYQRNVQEVNDRFSSAFDGMGASLYGSEGDLTAEQQAARDEVSQTAWGLLSYELQRGNTQVDFSEVLRRAANATHSAQLMKERNKPKADKIKSRSRRRSNVGTRKRTAKQKVTQEEKDLYNRKPSKNPDFMAHVRDIIERAG